MVPVRRLPTWLAGFDRRHPGGDFAQAADGWVGHAPDGAQARLYLPQWAPAGAGVVAPCDLVAVANGLTYGVLVVRRAGYLVALITQSAVVRGKVGARHIHGRTAAGGWSQQRYARRRANQAEEIVGSAAEHARAILPSEPGGLCFLATGGDRALLAAAIAQPPGLPAFARGPHFAVGTPTKDTMDRLPDLVLQVGIEVVEPDSAADAGSPGKLTPRV